MSYSQDEINRSIALAEEVATAEKNLDTTREVELPTIQEITERILTKAAGLYAKLVDNPLAQQLLPQARTIIRIKESRGDAIDEKTAFGELRLAVVDAELVEDGEGDGDETDTPFTNPKANEDWNAFLDALASGDKGQAFLHLNLLLAGIKFDLVNTDLPPVAPPYDIPE